MSIESSHISPLARPKSNSFDLLRVPLLGRLLRWRHVRTLLQIPLFIVSVAMILHGLFGPDLAPKNLATTLSWVHFRGALVLILLIAGNFFCMACPFMLARNIARRFVRPRWNWPRHLRKKWVSAGLFIGILFVYELFDLWASPWWTAWLIIGYFSAVLVVDGLFKHAAFCKFVCPIGQFNFVASTVSPLEVKVVDNDVCERCRTKDCIRGRREPASDSGPGLVVIQRGCELALFQPRKNGNMDCTFCLDCVQACPHGNIGILNRLPAEELMADPIRSGIGFFSRRKDISALVLIFTFGALLNAFGMVSPVYAVESWAAGILHVKHEAPVLALIFALFLILEPVFLVGLAAWLTQVWGGVKQAVVPVAVRYSYSLVPLGFGVWLAHYGFHFLTGLYTFIPVAQNAVAASGWALLGQPRWSLTGLPASVVHAFELGFLGLGLAGSVLVSYRLAESEQAPHPSRVCAIWACVALILWVAAMWLMAQPMEMRGLLLGGG
ncbi:MAG TPA: FesM [Blastocatellia bacterium]|nr:FesM [Blastocatellia bacterium]